MARSRSITSSVRVLAPAAQVWELLCATRRYAEWVENTLAVVRVDADVAAVGVTYDERNKVIGPFTARSTWRVVEVDTPRRARHEGTGIPLARWMALETLVDPVSDESCDYTHVFSYQPALGPLGPLVDAAIRPSLVRDMRATAQSLKALAERERRPSA